MRLERVKIGEIAKVKGGKRLPQGYDVQDEPTDHPYLRVVDFDDNGLNSAHVKFISNEVHEKIRRYTITDEDIFVSIAGTIGRVGIVPALFSGANLTENAAKITDISESVDAPYLYYFLKGHTGQELLKSKAGGTSQPKLALYRLAEIEFPKPSFQAQRRIARVLSAYDDLIENNRQRIALLEEAARLLYREWFVHLRFPGHEHINDGRPEGWERRILSHIAETNKESYRAKELPDEINYIDISSVAQGRVVSRTRVPASEAPGRARRKIRDGDIIWSNVRPNLRAYALMLEPGELDVVSTGFTVLTATKVPFTWLYMFVTTDNFVGHLANHATGAGYPAVRPDDFERAELPMPSRTLLDHFHEAAEPNFRLICKLDLQNQRLAQARDLLLPRLMNGEVAV